MSKGSQPEFSCGKLIILTETALAVGVSMIIDFSFINLFKNFLAPRLRFTNFYSIWRLRIK